MTPKDPISTPMTEKTARAIGSTNPFNTPSQPPRSLDGRPIKPIKPLQSFEDDTELPFIEDEGIPAAQETQEVPDDVAEFLASENEPVLSGVTLAEAEESFNNPIIESRNPDGLPSYRCEFAGRDIFVAWPWYKTTNPVTAMTQVAYALDFGRDKIRFDMSIGDSKIEHARNRLAHKFLETDAKWMLMIDDDIIPSIGRPAWMRYWVRAARDLQEVQLQRHGVHRLVGANKTLVGGAYFGRQEGGALMCSDHSLFTRAKQYDDAVVPVDWIGTGFILIHRKVFQDIRSHYGNSLKIDVPDYDYDYFRPFDSVGGEDVAFCKRAKEAGHQPHLDIGIPIFHVGVKTY